MDRDSLTPQALKPARKWLHIFSQDSVELRHLLSKLYGERSSAFENKRAFFYELLRLFIENYGADRDVILCRAPGRVNLLGRHIEHRGGYVNVMAIDREVLLVAAPRNDDVVRLSNADATNFPAREFRLTELSDDGHFESWLDFITSAPVQRLVRSNPGDWSHYLRAPLLKLLFDYRDVTWRGMDCLVSGAIPIGSGLSSSSALVVGAALAALAINGLKLATEEFINLCSEAEWFVGSRGGGADHAAIYTGEYGHFIKIGFFPFRMEGKVSIPDDLRIVIAHSGKKAIKSAGAKDVFNQRVACYEFAEMLLRHYWPPAANIEHLRDLVPTRLGVEEGEIYGALKLLPPYPSRKEIKDMLPAQNHQRMEQVFATHDEPEGYDLRGVALFGISECMRSACFAEIFRLRDLSLLSRLIADSHDGDRLFSFRRRGQGETFTINYDDRSLDELAAQWAPLMRQPGRYACSIEEIDHLVDIADETKGVIGAQLAGAGLGGCAIVLLKADGLETLLDNLRNHYYSQRDIPYHVQVCTPVAGAGVLAFPE